MRSPAEDQNIQIDITNACNMRCSNCTRFCGNHDKTFFMDYDTFKRAVDSLDGFRGIIGIIGGEPTLHPQFDMFCEFLREKFGPPPKGVNRLYYPQKNFFREIRRGEFESRKLKEDEAFGGKTFRMQGPGIFSNMGSTYYDKYEVIQDTFHVQFLNDHINTSYHQPGLVSRKDLGIPDEEWVKLRDNCWLQNNWSASITPKGAFFCEIAGTLDMLFDGPGGWPIEPGWWKRKPEDFADQLHWCEICGFALNTFMRDAEDEIDDVSPTLYEMLKKVNSPGIKNGRTKIIKIENGIISEESKAHGKRFSKQQPFLETYEDRFNKNNSGLFVKDYEVLEINETERFGIELNRIIDNSKNWICLKTGSDFDKEELDEILKVSIINPGTLHIGSGYVLFSKRAISIKQMGFDRRAQMKSIEEFVKLWIPEKVICVSDITEKVKWKRNSIKAGKKYVIWGTGLSADYITDFVLESGGEVLFYLDKDENKTLAPFKNLSVYAPHHISTCLEDFDYLIVANYTAYDEIFENAKELGVDEQKIIMPYEL